MAQATRKFDRFAYGLEVVRSNLTEDNPFFYSSFLHSLKTIKVIVESSDDGWPLILSALWPRLDVPRRSKGSGTEDWYVCEDGPVRNLRWV